MYSCVYAYAYACVQVTFQTTTPFPLFLQRLLRVFGVLHSAEFARWTQIPQINQWKSIPSYEISQEII